MTPDRRAILEAFVAEVRAGPRVDPRIFLCVTYLDEAMVENRRLREALQLILPMAKGYAAAHPVGGNKEYIRDAEVALAAGEPDAPSKEGG